MPSVEARVEDTDFREKAEELLKVSRVADQEDRKLVDNMQSLLHNQDFQIYVRQVLAPRIENFGATLLEPSGSLDGAVRSEFVKGALYGLCLARDLPTVIIASTTRSVETTDE
jgi:hypothetical protein